MRVRIKKAYGGQQSNGALDVTPAKWGGGDMETARKGREVQKSLTSVPREKANLEAEGGETAFGPISGDTIPDHYKISGPRHSNGGVPLNLPDDTFIFSDTRAMKITDPKILKMFGKKAKKGGYTPAELAKPYDINKYKEILMDPDSDRKERETAELMIKNYIMKLGALALAQESKKGFPQGIPEMARPYMEANGITDEDLLPQTEEGGQAPQPMMKIGGPLNTYQGDEDGSTVNESKQKLEDLTSYQNATDQQKALFESLTPEQKKMMMGIAGQTGNQTSGYPGGYNQRGYGYSPATPYPLLNAFGQRAFTRDFNYLTPFKSPTYTGTNMPFTGSIPQGSNLTSVSQTYRKNPLLKSMFAGWIDPSKNVARRELTTTYNFNGPGSKTPSLAGGDNAISNFKVPQLDFNKGISGTSSTTGTEAGSMSNRDFARKMIPGTGKYKRRDRRALRRDLNRGADTQEEYMQAMSDANRDDPVAPTTGSGPIPKPDNSAIPSWITDPIGSALSGTSDNESMITDQIRNSVMNSGKIINEPSRLPIQPAGMLSRPTFKMPQSLQNQDAINRSTTPTANDAAFTLGSRLNQMRTNAGMYDTTPTNTPFDFSTDRTQPTFTFGQDPINTPLDTQGFKRAFGGESPILDMFVHGGNYEHGGFHMPTEDYAKNFQANTSTELPKLPFTQTADDPYVNPLTGESPAFVFNSKTRAFDETNPEYGEGNNAFSVSTTQKVNTASTLRPGVLLGQIGAAGRFTGDTFNAVNTGLNDLSNNQLAFMQGSKERTRRGGDRANEEGVMSTDAISPTSNMSYMTRFGGTPNRTRRVRILPRANTGLMVTDKITGKKRPMTKEEIIAYRKKQGIEAQEVDTIPEGAIDLGGGEYGIGTLEEGSGNVESTLGKGRSSASGPNDAWYDTICNQLKRGVTPEQLEADDHGYADAIRKQFADCIKAAPVNTQSQTAEIFKQKEKPVEVIEQKTGKKKCKCYKLDDRGNRTSKVISETVVNANEDCPMCEANVEVMRGADPKDPGGASDAELAALAAAARMRYRMPRKGMRFQQDGEFIPTLVSPRTAHITSQGREDARALKAAGLSGAAAVAATVSPGRQKQLQEQGRLYESADLKNAQILGDSAYKNMMNRMAVDKTNTALFNQNVADNIGIAKEEMRGKNARDAFGLKAFQAMRAGEGQRAALNYDLQDYQVDRNLRPYDRYNPKDPSLSKPKETLSQVYDRWKSKGMDDPNIGRLAVEEWKAQNARYGGFIPRYTTMPYGN